MYYHDRWSAKLWGSDAFMEIMIQTIRKLESLKRDTADARQKYLRVLEHIYEASNELLDHALRVTMLVVSDQHAEFEQLVTKEGPMTLKLLSQRASDIRNNSQFWSSDLGQVLHSALVRADPQRFKPTGTGDIENATAARVWNLWTDELRTVKRYEYSSVEEARLVFEQCRCCTVLVGPEGKMQEKSLAAATSQMLSKVLQEDSTLRELNRRVEQSLGLQRAALGLPFHEKVTAIEDFLEQTDSANGSADVSEAPNYWHDAVSKVRDAWMAGQTDASGVAELFRGGKKVKWIEGVFEKESKCSDFPTIILDLSKTFADLLCCHKEVMSAVRGMIGEGGSKEALAAIYALRQRNTITGQLDGCMQRFMASANLLHGFYEHMFFESLEGNKKIKGQTAPMQRLYFESIRSCGKIRDDILTQWHKLGLQVTDDNLAEEAKRIDMTEKAAFCQLMGMPSPTLALTGGSAAKAQLQLPDAEKDDQNVANAEDEDEKDRTEKEFKLNCVVENAMYMSCLGIYLQAIICIVTPFITNAELKVVRGTVDTPDVVDFATAHSQLFNLMSAARWIATAVLYGGVAVTCSYLWGQKYEPAWAILVISAELFLMVMLHSIRSCE
ncbi:Uncharacterized protein SCF082_LOCUS14592 [Durusdinium trenchii]|uniref:Uncharacterized protein n=1 Tax=Durusdinium trenchii TaxID=1381693 RepID=A0ABP0JYM4_9DINO